MKDHLRAAARALRDFLRGFTGIASVRPGTHDHEDDGSRRPFCC
ncbi:MAG TPA: hypothetical protein VII72_15025 [Myxococcota bacterium]|jgi:hypothetical protein